MLQAQIMDADFYPIVVDTHPAARRAASRRQAGSHRAAPARAAARSRAKLLFGLGALLLCLALLGLLGVRAAHWNEQRQQTQLLALVNPWNSVEHAGFTPELVDIGGGKQLDSRCAEALGQMLADCAAAGNEPVVASAYRTRETQEQLYQDKVRRLIDAGLSQEEAPSIAAMEVARPGTSEHELGLAVDLVDAANQALDQSQERTSTQQWLMANCWRYGFILRYPNGRSGITGIIYEPWHYRYVGPEAAGQITQLGVTLEEYLSMFYSEEANVVFEE